jgi:ABC-type amino acid transport substrate-binding protein
MKSPLLLASLLLVGCGSIPADPDGTLERVREERRFKVGLIASHTPPPRAAADFLRSLSRSTGAIPAVERGPADGLLTRLEDGELDLVLGEFAEESPWATKVTLSEPILGKGPTIFAAATKNGENAWIALVHREALGAASARE